MLVFPIIYHCSFHLEGLLMNRPIAELFLLGRIMCQTKLKSSFLAAVVVLASLAGATPVRASQFVIPDSLANIDANGSNAVSGLIAPFPTTFQTQITAAELAMLGLNIGDQLTGVRTRLNGGEATGPASAINVTDLEITMAVAANAIGSMSNTFANNMTSPVLVRDGAYTLPANSMPGGNTPNAFGPLIPFDTAYTYQGGDLIFMYAHPATATSLVLDFAVPDPGPGLPYRSLGGNFHGTTGGLTNNMGVHQFEVVVPEPASLALALLTATAGTLLRRSPSQRPSA
jgi:hypothetical protein